MGKNDQGEDVGDTQRTDLLMSILQELRELREWLLNRDVKTCGRIGAVEKELELVRIEQQANGTKLAEMELSQQRRRRAKGKA
jgi:hypothetical protein